MQKDTKSKDLNAIGLLLEYCSNKRYGVKENVNFNSELGMAAIELNDKFSKINNLNIFSTNETKDILEYEKLISNYSSSIIKKSFKNNDIQSEIKFLNSQIDIPVNWIQNFTILLSHGCAKRVHKSALKEHEVLDYCKHPDFISVIPQFGSVFVTRKISLKGVDRVMFVHLVNMDQYSQGNENLVGGVSQLEEFKGNLIVLSILLLEIQEFEYMISQPVNVFLKAINLHGLHTIVNGEIHILHTDIILPGKYTFESADFFKVSERTPGEGVAIYIKKNSNIAITLVFFYLLRNSSFFF